MSEAGSCINILDVLGFQVVQGILSLHDIRPRCTKSQLTLSYSSMCEVFRERHQSSLQLANQAGACLVLTGFSENTGSQHSGGRTHTTLVTLRADPEIVHPTSNEANWGSSPQQRIRGGIQPHKVSEIP
jgi:hypothetical protein